MRNGDQRLGTLPGRKSLQIDHSILGNNIVRAGARVGADGAGGKRGNDTALYAAVFAGDGGRHADEALAALGKIRAQQEIELTARAGDVFGTGGLGIDLTEEVAVDGVVDGNEVVDLGNDMNIIGIIDRSAHDGRVAVHIIIELFGAGGKGEDLAALVNVLVPAGDLARHGHVNETVNIHFGVNGKILQVRLRDHGADGVGHTADTELEACAVGDLRNHKIGNGTVDLGRLTAAAKLRNGRILPLNDHINVFDIDLTAGKTADPGHILVDFNDDRLRALQHIGKVGSCKRVAEIAVLVHGSDLDHGDINADIAVAIKARKLGVTHGRKITHAFGDDLAINAAAVPGVPGKVLTGVLISTDRRHPHGHAAANLDVFQLIFTPGKRLIERVRMVRAPAVIDPVTGFDGLDGFGCGSQFFLIKSCKIHGYCSPYVK